MSTTPESPTTITAKYLVCKEHIVFSTFQGSLCGWCAQESRQATYQSQKDGTYKYESIIPPAAGFNSGNSTTEPGRLSGNSTSTESA